MNKNLAFDFIVNKETKSITIKREFSADLPLVWDAYTKPELLDQWWAPRPWKAKTKRMDFKEGGQWLYVMAGPNGEEHWSIANYTNIQLHKKYTGLDGFSDEDGNINPDMPQSKWEVSFTEKGDTTLVDYKISFDDLAQLEAIIQMGFKEGMAMALQNLDELLVTLQ